MHGPRTPSMVAARLSILLLVAAVNVAAQPTADRALRGVVWTPTADLALANEDLGKMREYGVEAVRTPAGIDGAVLAAADRAGIALFLDLPVRNLPASLLADTLAYAERHLEAVIRLAARHPSIQGVGLAHGVDTSDPEACPFLEALAERARAAGLWTYYKTRFIENDRCAAAVDAVLLGARDRRPARLLARWNAVHDTPAGIGALGAEVRDDVSGGHLTPRSPAAQARSLENALREVLRLEPGPPVVFVHRWRGPFYGLHDPENRARPAASVVSGFYSGRQTVFAIDAGPEPPAPPGATSFMIIGWSTVLVLVVVLTFAVRFRELIPRYFARHGYYREAVQRSASIESYGAAGIGAALAVSAGIIVGVLMHALTAADVFEVLLGGMVAQQQEALRDVLQQPLLMVLIGASIYAFWLVLNMVWLRALAGRRYRVRPLQAGTLTVLSRWPVFVLAVLALLAAQSDDVLRWLPWLLGLWAATEFVALVRMLYDYSRITRVPMQRAIVTGVGAPLAGFVVALILVAAAAGPQLQFLWHMATRS